VYVDVRTTGEFEQGHPEGAWNLPIAFSGGMGMRPNPDFVEVATRVLPKDAPLLIGCKSGGRSLMACRVLAQAGFTNVANVAGGYHGGEVPGWVQCGLPSTRQAAPGRSWDELRSGG
jgi:rhodanese-related sulfurtransferase